MKVSKKSLSSGSADVFQTTGSWSIKDVHVLGRPANTFSSRWYRAPELLYGARKYDEGVDLWYVQLCYICFCCKHEQKMVHGSPARFIFQGSWMYIWRTFEQFTIVSGQCIVELIQLCGRFNLCDRETVKRDRFNLCCFYV